MRALTVFLFALLLGFGGALPAAQPDPEAGDAFRLAGGVVPRFQAIRLAIDPQQPDYSGSVRIELEVREATDRFRFHAEQLRIDSVELFGAAGEVALSFEPQDPATVAVTTDDWLSPGAYELRVAFSNDLDTRALGLYRMELEGSGYVFSQFQPDEARRAFPCWDEPGFKIPFQLTLEVPATHEAVSNTPVESTAQENGRKRVVFRRTPPLPTYLLAVAVGPLESVPIPGLSVPGRIYTVRGQAHLAGLAARTTPEILTRMESYFGSPYPYAKLDLIAVPEYWFGAMEHPGAVTYSDQILLLPAEAAGAAQRSRLVRVTAHELAHMWFGNLVTMAWWDDFWLNESFADWMGDKIAHESAPELALDLTELESVQRIMRLDGRPSTRQIQRPVTSTDNLFEDLGLTYYKGKAVLAMFEQWLGAERFRDGIRRYVEANAWGTATSADLWRALSEVAEADVAAALAGFIRQPGLPLIEVVRTGPGELRLAQRRFLTRGVRAEPATWQVPVFLKYPRAAGEERQTVLLTGPSALVRLHHGADPGWVYPNAGSSGYYRWIVPQTMLRAIAAEASARLEPRERIGFLGNSSALLDAGELRGDEFLQLLAPFAADPSPQVVSALLGELEKVRTAFVPDAMRGEFAVWVHRTLKPALERVGLRPRPGESETLSLLRPRLLAWLGEYGRHDEVLRNARRVAKRFMKDPASVEAPEARVALRLRALGGSPSLFEKYRRGFEAARLSEERAIYLGAMGNFEDPDLRARALEYVLEGPLRPNELFDLPRVLSDSEAGRELVYRWMTEHYDRIAVRIPESFLAYLPFTATGCSRERLAHAQVFFEAERHQVPGTLPQLRRVTDQVDECVGLREAEGPAVTEYLRRVAAGEGRRATRTVRLEAPVRSKAAKGGR